jgi:hypothetical protein
MIKVIFDATRQELIFALMTVLKKIENEIIGNETYVLMFSTPELLTQRKITQVNENLARQESLPIDWLDEQEKFYLIGFCPDDENEKVDLKNFLDTFSQKIALWIDQGNWPQDILDYASSRGVKIRIHPTSCLDKLKSLGYDVPILWQGAAKNFNPDNDRSIKFALGERYYLALLASRVLVQNTFGAHYWIEANYLNTFVAILEETEFKKNDKWIDSLRDLGKKIFYATEIAKEEINSYSEYFQEAKTHNRPVGFIKLNDGEQVDVEDVLKHGYKKYPWLCAIAYSIGGQKCLIGQSKYFSVKEFLDSYASQDISQVEFLKLLNAEVININLDKKANRAKIVH